MKEREKSMFMNENTLPPLFDSVSGNFLTFSFVQCFNAIMRQELMSLRLMSIPIAGNEITLMATKTPRTHLEWLNKQSRSQHELESSS